MVQITSNYRGSETEVVEYLTSLWSDNTNFPINAPKKFTTSN